MKAIHHAIEVVKQSEEMVIVFSVTLQVVNFIKEKEYTSLRIKDLLSLENYKDNSKDNHLLYHIMRKVVEAKQKEETKKKAEAMRAEEEQWVTSATYQLPIFSPVDLGDQPWLSDNYRKSRFFFKITKFDLIAFYETK